MAGRTQEAGGPQEAKVVRGQRLGQTKACAERAHIHGRVHAPQYDLQTVRFTEQPENLCNISNLILR
jgi:hypothetical protein